MNQLALTATIEIAVSGQRSGPKGDSTLPKPVLTPMPASAIGRMQQEHAAISAPKLLTRLRKVVLRSPGRSGAPRRS